MKLLKRWKEVKRKKLYVTASGAVVICICVLGAFFIFKKESKGQMPSGSMVQSATAETGSISTTIAGTGNIGYESASDIEIPSGVEVKEVLVDSGDVVAAGDVLATLDASSVTKALASVQEEIAKLDEEISEAQADDSSGSVTSQAAGRIKWIYAAEGSRAADVILQNGALAVVSTDGKMAVDVETAAAVNQWDTVEVVLSDGVTAVTGTIETVAGSSCTVTLTDQGTTLGEAVTVKLSDGTALGNGTLYVHEPFEILAASGTVSAVYAAQEEEISAGTTVMSLTGTDASSAYQELAAERETLSKVLKRLLELSKSNAVTAEAAGVVQSVNVSADSSTAVSGAADSNSSGASASASSVTGQPDTAAVSANQSDTTADEQTTAKGFMNAVSAVSYQTGANLSGQIPETSTSGTAQDQLKEAGCPDLMISAPVTGEAPQEEITETEMYRGTLTWNPSVTDKAFAENTVYSAEVVLTAKAGCYFPADLTASCESAVVSGLVIDAEQEGNSLKMTLTFPKTEAAASDDLDSEEDTKTAEDQEAKTDSSSDTQSPDNSSSGKDSSEASSDTDKNSTKEKADTEEKDDSSGKESTENTEKKDSTEDDGSPGKNNTDENNPESEKKESDGTSNENGASGEAGSEGVGAGGRSGGADIPSGGSAAVGVSTGGSSTGSGSTGSGSSGSGSSSGTSDNSSADSGSGQMVAAFTVSAQDNMVLSVSVDELDILSVKKGQPAEITLDAIEGKSFEGTITKVSNTASSSGGVTKYTVELTVQKDDAMLSGMSASATIITEEKTDVVKIPVKALQEKGSSVFVYTQQDAETGNLSGETEVETGLSDGDYVEIVSGLSEGDSVYFTRTGSSSSSGQSDHTGGFPSGEGGSKSGEKGEAPSGMSGGMEGGRGSMSGGQKPSE